MRANTNHRYLARIETVVDALLSAPAAAHSVESLAALAHMSEYHFHRVFRSVMGETVHATVRRVRLGFAADRLVAGTEPVAQIAYASGYESPESFARAFRALARSTPVEFRRRHRRDWHSTQPRVVVADADVELVDQPACEALAWRHDGPIAAIPQSVRLFWQWQLRRALLPHVRQRIGIVYPDRTEPRGIHYYAGILVDPTERATDDVVRLSLPGGRYARYALHGPGSQIAPAFVSMQRDWLPASGYTLDARPLLERYFEPFGVDEPVIELLLPVRPA